MTTQTPESRTTPNRAEREPRALGGLFRPPRRVRTIVLLVLAVITGAVCWYVGMDLAHAITIAVVIAAVGITWIAVPEHGLPDWSEDELRSGDGVRFDVLRLSWMLRSRRRTIQSGGLRRAREIARERIAHYGLDLENPADRSGIEALIGQPAYATLWAPADRMPRLSDLVRCLDTLDRLDSSAAARPIRFSAQSRAKPSPSSATRARQNYPEIRMPKLEERP